MDYRPLIALALLLPAFAWAEEVQYPPRRAGLWVGTIKSNLESRTSETKYCIDATTGHTMTEADNQELKEMGAQISEKVEGNTIHSSAVAKIGTGTLTMELTLTYSGDAEATTGLTEIVHASFDPPSPEPGGNTHDTEIEMHWVGACPPDMKPGDMIIDGQKRNIADRTAK